MKGEKSASGGASHASGDGGKPWEMQGEMEGLFLPQI